MPFGGESGWDANPPPFLLPFRYGSSVPFGGESGWDRAHPPETIRVGTGRLQCLSAVSPGGTNAHPEGWEVVVGVSSVPFGGESGWDKMSPVEEVAPAGVSSVPFGGESGWDSRKAT